MQYFSTALFYARNENPNSDFTAIELEEQDRLVALWMGEQTLTDLLDPVTQDGERAIVEAIATAACPPMHAYESSMMRLACAVVGTLRAHAHNKVAQIFDEHPATAIAARG